ncbi:MAG TPA: hemolysin III family protein [Anaerolineales bacterium]|nr:hemolysin III family protein [Anaerolineales bacterium]
MIERLQAIVKDPISGLIHLVSAVAALVGAVVVAARPAAPAGRAALLVYGLSLVLIFTASSLYHLVRATPKVELWLRKLDHVAIYLFIAGTYTPVCVIVLTGAWRWGMLGGIWLLAFAGILVKLVSMKSPRWLTVAIYLGMGWLGVVGVRELLAALPLPAMWWLLAGGLLYSAGAVVYVTRRPDFVPGVFGFHEVWHIFVSAAGAAHYVFVLGYVAPLAGG